MSGRYEGLGVKCPNCRRVFFRTTAAYSPGLPVNGAMVAPTVRYALDWLQTSTVKAAEMCCPECLAPLAPKGELWVLMSPGPLPVEAAEETAPPAEDVPAEKPMAEPEGFVCDICGKVVSTKMALKGHMRSHNK